MKTISHLLLALSLGVPATVFAQNEIQLDGQEFSFPQESKPRNLVNFQNSCYFLTDKGVVNNLGGLVLSDKQIENLSVSPKGDLYAVIRKVGKDKKVHLCKLWKSSEEDETVSSRSAVLSSTFSPDGSVLYVGDIEGNVSIFDCLDDDYDRKDVFKFSIVPNKLIVSKDGKILAAANGQNVEILRIRNAERKILSMSANVTAMDFSEDSQELAVLSSSGVLTIYNTRNFKQKFLIESLGEARDCYYHPKGKYIAVVTGDSQIKLVNLSNNEENLYVQAAGTGITDVFFCKDGKGDNYMVYNTSDAIHYKQINNLQTNITKLVDDEVLLRMEEWEQRMPEETLEQYQMRVNDETRPMQMRLFEEEIATRMAMDMGGASLMAFESYNPETNMMSLDMGEMSDIYIQVPMDEVGYFMNSDDIEIRNAIYGVDRNDKMEMVYADVYNKKTGKTYTFNNRERQSLEYLTSDNRFIPLTYVQQGAKDEMKLDEIRQNVVTEAMENKTISDHTKISVSTKTMSEVDADGTKHVNYQVSFDYTVEASFSEREDFGPGKYQSERSAAAQTLLSIINKSMQTEFANYTGAGKKAKITITGSADAMPIRRKIPYGGEYGDQTNAPVVKDDVKTEITVTTATGITSNDQLAFLRALGMKHNVSTNVTALNNMQSEYEIHIKQAEGIGGEFRRIHVDFTFYDAF